MRDTMIKNGDIVIGSSGNTVLLEGSDAKFQQAVLCISAKLGGFKGAFAGQNTLGKAD